MFKSRPRNRTAAALLEEANFHNIDSPTAAAYNGEEQDLFNIHENNNLTPTTPTVTTFVNTTSNNNNVDAHLQQHQNAVASAETFDAHQEANAANEDSEKDEHCDEEELQENEENVLQSMLSTKDAEFVKVFQVPALKAAFAAFCSTRKIEGTLFMSHCVRIYRTMSTDLNKIFHAYVTNFSS